MRRRRSRFDTTQFVRKELDILGARNATAEDFRAVMDLLLARHFPVSDAVTRVVSMGDAACSAPDVGRASRLP